MTKYICLEGGEGCYKTTTAKALAEYYRDVGFKVLETKEPGTQHLPLTMELRKIMLSNEYDSSLTRQARELISQAIRSVHIEKLITPVMESEEYDLIIQDRGILSGIIYGSECGNSREDLLFLNSYIMPDVMSVYDHTFVFHNEQGLKIATGCKDEFGAGDAMESRGDEFHTNINQQFREACAHEGRTWTMSHHDVAGKTTEQIVLECVKILGL